MSKLSFLCAFRWEFGRAGN